MEAVTNTKHCSRIFKNYSVQISLFLYSHFGLDPDAARTQYLTHTAPTSFTFFLSLGHPPDSSPLHYKPCRLWAQESVAVKHLNPSPSSRCLAVSWLPRQLDASCIAVRMTPSPSAVGWLCRHPLTASPWKDFIAIRCRTVTSLPRHPLDACCIAVLSSGLRKANPRGENPVGRLFPYSLDIGLYSVVSLLACSTLFQTMLSVSFFRMVRESSGGLVHGNVLSLSRTGSLQWLPL
jgi:hypothetical protein